MSVALMTEAWRLDIPATDKLVLIALADSAHDDGITWLAVKSRDPDKLDILTKTSLSERAVQGAIKRLCEAGYLHRTERPGKGVIYRVDPRRKCAPQEMRPAGNDADPRTSCGENVSKPQSPKEAKRVRASKRCPEDWSPSEQTIMTMTAEGFSAGEIERALSMVRDHQFRDAHTDWDAVLRNWLRKDRKPAHDRPDHHNRPSSRDARLERMLAGAQRAVGPEPGLHPVGR